MWDKEWRGASKDEAQDQFVSIEKAEQPGTVDDAAPENDAAQRKFSQKKRRRVAVASENSEMIARVRWQSAFDATRKEEFKLPHVTNSRHCKWKETLRLWMSDEDVPNDGVVRTDPMRVRVRLRVSVVAPLFIAYPYACVYVSGRNVVVTLTVSVRWTLLQVGL